MEPTGGFEPPTYSLRVSQSSSIKAINHCILDPLQRWPMSVLCHLKNAFKALTPGENRPKLSRPDPSLPFSVEHPPLPRSDAQWFGCSGGPASS